MERDLYRDMFENEERFWWFAARRQIVADLIGRFAHKKNKLADLGCGCGYNLHAFSDMFDQVTGLDTSPEAIEFSKKRGIIVVEGSLPDNVPLEPASFDVVLMMDVLEHVNDDKGSAAAGVKLLTPGGILIATVPAHQWMWTHRDDRHHHKRRYTKSQIEELFKNLPVEKVLLSYYNSLLFPVMVISRLSARLGLSPGDKPDTTPPPEPVNRLLEKLFAADRYLLGRVPVIWGGSVVGVYKKKP